MERKRPETEDTKALSGLMQVINAKGDAGEIEEILDEAAAETRRLAHSPTDEK